MKNQGDLFYLSKRNIGMIFYVLSNEKYDNSKSVYCPIVMIE